MSMMLLQTPLRKLCNYSSRLIRRVRSIQSSEREATEMHKHKLRVKRRQDVVHQYGMVRALVFGCDTCPEEVFVDRTAMQKVLLGRIDRPLWR